LEIILLIILIAGAWFWLDTIAKREAAIYFGKTLAQRWQLQLLDETVACTSIKLARDSRGHAQFLREYAFELSANGAERMPCTLKLLGKQLHSWDIPPYLQPIDS
jgi:hypothetical protein